MDLLSVDQDYQTQNERITNYRLDGLWHSWCCQFSVPTTHSSSDPFWSALESISQHLFCFVSNEALLPIFAEIHNYPGTISIDGWCLNMKVQLLCLKHGKTLRCNWCPTGSGQGQDFTELHPCLAPIPLLYPAFPTPFVRVSVRWLGSGFGSLGFSIKRMGKPWPVLLSG